MKLRMRGAQNIYYFSVPEYVVMMFCSNDADEEYDAINKARIREQVYANPDGWPERP